MSTGRAAGAANDAAVETDEREGQPSPADRHLEYLATVADEHEAAVKNVEQTIADLQASLKDRKAAAKQFREEHARAVKSKER